MISSLKHFLLSLPAGRFLYGVIFYIVPVVLVCVYLGDQLMPLLISVIFAYVVIVFKSALEQMGVSHKYSFLIVSVGFFLFFGLFAFYLFPILYSQFPKLLMLVPEAIRHLNYALVQYTEGFIDDEALSALYGFVATLGDSVSAYIKASVSKTYGSFLFLLKLTVYFVLVPIITYFMVKDQKSILSYFSRFFTDTEKSSLVSFWGKYDKQLANYIKGKAIEGLIVSLVSFVLFAYFGLQYSVLLAFFVGVSVFIPFLGAILVTIPVAALGLSQFGFSFDFYVMFGLYFLIQVLDGNVLVPYIFSEKMKLHPVAILMSVILVGSVGGVLGMFLAIPLLAALTIYLEDFSRDSDAGSGSLHGGLGASSLGS